jgi:hypothetical protein
MEDPTVLISVVTPALNGMRWLSERIDASGDLTGFLACDDILPPDTLEEVAWHTRVAADTGSSGVSGGWTNAG